MIRKYANWYNSLTSFKKLGVSFSITWIYWFIMWLIISKFILDESHSIGYHIFHATWMAFFMNILFSWKNLKLLVKNIGGKKEDKASHEV